MGQQWYHDIKVGLMLGFIGNFPIITAFTSSLLANYYRDKTVSDINDYFRNYVDIK